MNKPIKGIKNQESERDVCLELQQKLLNIRLFFTLRPSAAKVKGRGREGC